MWQNQIQFLKHKDLFQVEIAYKVQEPINLQCKSLQIDSHQCSFHHHTLVP